MLSTAASALPTLLAPPLQIISSQSLHRVGEEATLEVCMLNASCQCTLLFVAAPMVRHVTGTKGPDAASHVDRLEAPDYWLEAFLSLDV